MNVRKPANYNTMYREVAEILTQNLPQMEEIHAIGKAVSRRPEKGAAVAAAEFLQANFPDRTGFSPCNVSGCAILTRLIKKTKGAYGGR